MAALNFNNQLLTGNDFSGQNLNGSTFVKASLTNVLLVGTILPLPQLTSAPILTQPIVLSSSSPNISMHRVGNAELKEVVMH